VFLNLAPRRHDRGDGRGRCPRRIAAGNGAISVTMILQRCIPRGVLGKKLLRVEHRDARRRGAAACFDPERRCRTFFTR